MSEVNKTEELKGFLDKHLDKINTVVGALVGLNIELRIVMEKDYKNQDYLTIENIRNLNEYCGIMSIALKQAFIRGKIYDFENCDVVTIDFNVEYELKEGGSNGFQLLMISINKNTGFIKVV